MSKVNKSPLSKVEGLIPTLRFPEFKNEGEWIADTLINLSKFRRGSFPQPYGSPEWYDEINGSPFIQVFDVGDDFRLKPTTKSKISQLAAQQSVFIRKGTVIITIQGSIGRVAITQYDAYIDRTLLLFEEIYNEIDKIFFAYVLFILFEIEKLKAPGGIIKTITKEVLSDFIINIPKLKEQQKIASCLSSLDEVITAHSQKLESLKHHKKWLMQNLFPQEGETVPSVRFPEFIEAWKKVKLKDVSLYFNGGSYENNVKEEGKYELITLKSINTSGKLINSKRYVDIEVPTLTKGTLVMILSEQAPGLIGMTAIIPADNKYVLNQRVAEIRPSKKVECYFLSMAINRNQIYFSKQGAGTKVQNISKPNVENYEFLIPENFEQQKIASSLSSLDAVITSEAEKIEQLKLHKKALMQCLFPKATE